MSLLIAKQTGAGIPWPNLKVTEYVRLHFNHNTFLRNFDKNGAIWYNLGVPKCVITYVHITIKPVHDIYKNVVCATSKASDQPAQTRSLIRAFASRLSIL